MARALARQCARPSIVSCSSFGFTASMPSSASLTVNPDHHTKSRTVAGP
jgi:hypothetical protein